MNKFYNLFILLTSVFIFNSCHNNNGTGESLTQETDTTSTSADDSILADERPVDTLSDNHLVFHVGSFSSIKATGSLDIRFEESDDFSVEAEGQEELLERLKCKVEGGDLLLYLENKNDTIIDNSTGDKIIFTDGGGVIVIGGNGSISNVSSSEGSVTVNGKTFRSKNLKPLKITIKGKLSRSLSVSGSCHFTTGTIDTKTDFRLSASGSSGVKVNQVSCKNIVVDESGSSDILLAQVKADNMNADISGASQCDININCNNMHVDLSGASKCDVNTRCGNHIAITATGASQCEISGTTKTINVSKYGSSLVDISNLQKISNE